LWRWSIDDLDDFWQSIWDCFGIESPTPHSAGAGRGAMPGAVWFPGAQVNYARQVLRHVAPRTRPASRPHQPQRKGQHRELSWPELRRQVAALALHLKAQGLQPGDRVAAYLPNVPEAMVAFLAVVSVGGVWSICAPDMGTNAVLDRFKQIEPKVLIACDGVTYGGKDHDRPRSSRSCGGLPSVRHVLGLRNLGGSGAAAGCLAARGDGARRCREVAAFEPMWVAFDHPLWIVYSSGTTGLPKPIVHGHGGVMS
jgi:acetoacetyl-CoA synthetase